MHTCSGNLYLFLGQSQRRNAVIFVIALFGLCYLCLENTGKAQQGILVMYTELVESELWQSSGEPMIPGNDRTYRFLTPRTGEGKSSI